MGINNLLLTLPSHVRFLPFILQLNISGNRCPALATGLTPSGEIEHWVFTSVVSCYLWTVCSDSVISVFFKRLLYFLLLIHIPDVNSSHIFTVKSHVIAALTFYLALLLAMLRFSPFISQLYLLHLHLRCKTTVTLEPHLRFQTQAAACFPKDRIKKAKGCSHGRGTFVSMHSLESAM